MNTFYDTVNYGYILYTVHIFLKPYLSRVSVLQEQPAQNLYSSMSIPESCSVQPRSGVVATVLSGWELDPLRQGASVMVMREMLALFFYFPTQICPAGPVIKPTASLSQSFYPNFCTLQCPAQYVVSVYVSMLLPDSLGKVSCKVTD